MGLDLLLVSGLQTPKTMALFILIGALATGYAASAILRGIRFAKKMQRVGVQALGLIISQRSVQRGGRGNFETYLVPKVRYQLPDGKILEGESAGGGEVEFYDGQEAYLLYDKNKPTKFLFVQEINQNQLFSSYALLLVFTLIAVASAWTALELLFT
ncbi:MAG TPA: DUF3592 domain-containing protein [Hymenobacter sp.]|uniref:DUF3592 domain-containing protein n=1 Tax=Hymenobacter sp. TaxID=1898978 RepID=UPI002D7E5A19|nr:DUF3592 domain-containing protein [Hymenobacter sp.]HET9505453.1 DUF3592 domain-containing protein [Hymenobacter sp.]